MRVVAAASVLFGTWMAAPGAEAAAPDKMPIIFRFPTPPAGFTPLTATNEDLARYGLPPRPSGSGNTSISYRAWSRAMAAAKMAVAPEVIATGRQHIRAVMVNATKNRQAGTMYSTNWAGQTILNPVGAFGPGSYAEVLGEWQIAAVQQAIGTCGGTDVSASWIGIDGTGSSSDVLQAGTEGDASCSGGVTRPSYYAWFEWYPGYEYELTNFPIAPGQSFLVVVQATSATTANATFVNAQSNQYTVIGFSAPAGTRLTGNSVEWIVERPSINNVLGTLADYGLSWMSSEVAFLESGLNTNTYDVPGIGGPGRTPYTLNMVDSNGNLLTKAFPQGVSAQYFNVEGSAY